MKYIGDDGPPNIPVKNIFLTLHITVCVASK